MSKTIKRAATMLIALVLMVCGLFLIKDIPITAEANYTPTGLMETGWYSFDLGASFPNLNFMGKWSHNKSDRFTIHWMHTADPQTNGKIVYCIDPGVNLSQHEKYTEYRGLTYFNDNANDINSTLTGEQLGQVLAHVISYGWQGNYTDITSGANARDNLSKLMATQYLIWETIVGERDAQFNHVDPAPRDAILKMLPTNMPDGHWRADVLAYYEIIEKKVQDSFKIPSFCAPTLAQSDIHQLKMVDLGGSSQIYGRSITLTDTNGVLERFNVDYTNDQRIHVSAVGNQLKIEWTRDNDETAATNITLTLKDEYACNANTPIVWYSSWRQKFIGFGEKFTDPLFGYVRAAYSTFFVDIIKETDPAGGLTQGWEFTIYSVGSITGDEGGEEPSIGDPGIEGPTIGDEVPEGAPGIAPMAAPRMVYKVVRTGIGGSAGFSLPKGTYIIQETGYPANTDPSAWDVTFPANPSAIDGVPVDPSTQHTITVGEGGTHSVTFTNKMKASLKIRKTVTGMDFDEAILYGWSFDIFTNSACTQYATASDGSALKGVTTASDGTIAVGLEPGKDYWIKENHVVPPGQDEKNWVFDDHIEHVKMPSAGGSVEAHFDNKYVTSGYGEIIKKSTNGGTVTGWKFSIYKNSTCTTLAKTADGATAQNLTTNASGKINVELEPGEYWVQEVGYPSSFTAAAQGYWTMDKTPRKITISSGKTSSVTFTNNWIGKVNLKKTANNGGRVDDWEITIYSDEACNHPIKSYRTGADGTILISDFSDEGTYYAKETNYPKDLSAAERAYWEMDETPKRFTLKAGTTTTVTFNNNWRAGLSIEKTSTNGGTVQGWKMSVYSDPGCNNLVTTFTTRAISSTRGIGDTKYLAPGQYWVKETGYPDGFTDEQKSYWEIDETPKQVTLSAGKTSTVSFNNDWLGRLAIRKTATPSGTVEGWQFTVYSDAACRTVVQTLTTNKDGYAESKNLTPGATYYIKETAAPAGVDTSYWVIDTSTKNVTIEAGKTLEPTTAFVNHWYGKVSIDKALENPEAGSLEGWLFTIYTDSACTKIAKFADGTPAENLRTDRNGHILSEKLERGTYWVKEVGYEGEVEWDYWVCSSANNPQQVTVTEGATANVKFRNALRPGTITVTKVSDDGSVLAGVQLMLEWYDETSNEWKPVTSRSTVSYPYVTRGTCTSAGLSNGVLTTGADGTVTFDGLYPLVQYRVTEVATLSGYQLLTEPVFVGKLTLEENLIKAFKPVNHKLVTLPVTGRYDILIFSAAAIVLTAAGIVVLMVTKRRRMDRG